VTQGLSTRELQSLTIWDISDPATQVSFDVLWKEFLRPAVNAETTQSVIGRVIQSRSRTVPKLMCCPGVTSPCCESESLTLMAPDPTSPPLILLVDDYEDARVMYGHFLRMSGYEPLEAATGEEALELAYSRVPDLILLDMSLPGIDGWEVTAELKRNDRTKHIPIVALTAHALQTERQRTERAGCDGFLAKPCAPPELLAEISRLLGPRPGVTDATRG
jgi:CheY-like chemotaxis protein